MFRKHRSSLHFHIQPSGELARNIFMIAFLNYDSSVAVDIDIIDSLGRFEHGLFGFTSTSFLLNMVALVFIFLMITKQL
jgi:hypothetical protein